MIKGSTPTHIFNIPFDTSLIDKLQIVYAQNDTEVFTKEKADCVLSGNTITVTLAEDETIKLECNKRMVQIQMRIKTTEGDVAISRMLIVELEKCLFSGVM